MKKNHGVEPLCIICFAGDAEEAIEQEMTGEVHEVPYDDSDMLRWPDGFFNR